MYKKQNDETKWISWKPVSFPKLTQSRLVPIQTHGLSELKKKKKKKRKKEEENKTWLCPLQGHELS